MTVNRELIRVNTIGHECVIAVGHKVSTRSFSRNANRQLLHGSAPFKFNNDELLVLFSSWKPKKTIKINNHSKCIKQV